MRGPMTGSAKQSRLSPRRDSGLLRCCSDRGHSLHLFGDIVDTFWVAQIDRSDLMSGKENSEFPVGTERANGEPLAAEGLRDFPEPPLEADIGLRRGDRTDELALVVLHRRKAIRHR